MGVERVEILPSFFFLILSLGSLFIPSCASSPNEVAKPSTFHLPVYRSTM